MATDPEVEELTDEALETILLMLGCLIIQIPNAGGLWHATQPKKHGCQYYYFEKDHPRSDRDKRRLMLACRDAFLRGELRLSKFDDWRET